MKIFNKISALTIAILALSLIPVNAQSFSDSKRPSAQTLEQQVQRKILYLSRYGIFDHILFKVNGDAVILYGKANTLGLKSEAENAVEDIPGVARVENQIEVLSPSPSDNVIRRQALRALSQHGLGNYLSEIRPSIRIIVENGRINLEGYVRNRGDYNLANITANGIPGVFSVQNNLIIGEERIR